MSTATLLHITSSQPRPGRTVLHIVGEIDAATVLEFALALESALAAGPEAVVLDLSRVGFLGTAGITEITGVAERAASAGVGVRVVVGEGRTVARALEVAGVPVPTSPDLDHALDS
ncbi:STAS domain-containing protein [Amycolatopsis sp. K13G38]|uniref:STAS domain-containing protein n=1 Tax=Amycolatopsis acididurans TaxID=2724524 RepID=A0ABX1JCC1_9PSEU|nr:STAS domain-containing protein [Amycolatopsis acididurans]NKQ57437.1 STAS domain-containing protein [Amycolatopsis acididurans]